MDSRIGIRRVAIRPALALMPLALWLLTATPVAAAAPDREPVLNSGFTDSSCGFDVVITIPAQNEVAKTFFDSDGNPIKMIISGRLVYTFTNPANEKSITANVSGPAIFDLVNGTAYFLGSGGGPSPSGLILGHGRLDASTFQISGTTVDLCPLLA